MAFKPTFINGRHYLMSKNSGSFPNWAIYLSGSNGSGKLWSEFRPTAAISCSVSSSTTFVTGSVYQVDVRILPGASASGIYVNGQIEEGVLGNGGGALTSTASLFVGNFSQNNTQNFSGSIYTIKTYLNASTEQPVLNYNATSTRFSKPPVPETAKKRYEILVVAGGGGGGSVIGGGGGAGGLQYIISTNLTSGQNTVLVGAGGAQNVNGQNSTLGSFTSISGGRGGSGGGGGGVAGNGGSGGGSPYNDITRNGLGTLGQGNNGGTGGAAGGGGAGTPGVSGARTAGGSGSYVASFAPIGGSPAGWFAGGGGAGSSPGGVGGGGFGAGYLSAVVAGTGSRNTGGGGGGGEGFAIDGGNAAAGGSGIVAIRYNGAPIAIGGEITQSAGFTYHVFRTVGTSSFTIF
jgi:hypothetical protein